MKILEKIIPLNKQMAVREYLYQVKALVNISIKKVQKIDSKLGKISGIEHSNYSNED